MLRGLRFERRRVHNERRNVSIIEVSSIIDGLVESLISISRLNLRNSLIKQPQDEDPDEGVKDLIEIVLRKLDKDKDGKVSLEDYRQSVLEEPLLLEAFGRCLPNERARDTFVTTMKM